MTFSIEKKGKKRDGLCKLKTDRMAQCATNLRAAVPVFLQRPSIYNKKYPRSDTRAFRRVYDTTKNQVTSEIFTVYHEKASHD